MSSECPWCSLRIVSTLPVNAGIIKCSLPPKQWGIAMLVQECTRNAEQLRCLAIWKPGNILLKMAHSKAAQAQNKWKVQAGIIPPRYSRRELFPDRLHLTSSFVSRCCRNQLGSTRKVGDLMAFKPKIFAHIVPKQEPPPSSRSLPFILRQCCVTEHSAMIEAILVCIVQYGSHLSYVAI